MSPGLVSLSRAWNSSRLATGLPLTPSIASPSLQLALRRTVVVDGLHRDGHRVLQVEQRRVLGAVLGLAEVGVVGLVDLVTRLVRRIDQIARHQLFAARHPQRQRLARGSGRRAETPWSCSGARTSGAPRCPRCRRPPCRRPRRRRRACRTSARAPATRNGTVTTAGSRPNATIGTSATSNVKIRLFTPPNVRVRSQRDLPSHTARHLMSTVEGMADLPFGFSSGDDPERDKRKKDPDSGSPSSGGTGGPAVGMGGSEFDMSQLGQIFSRLGEMFSGAGNVMAGGAAVGPGELRPGPPAGVEFDRFRRAHPREDQRGDLRRRPPGRDLARRCDRPARGHHQGRGVDPHRLGRQHARDLEAVVRSGGRADLHGVGLGAARRGQDAWPGRCCR